MKFAARVGDALRLPLNTERLGKLTEDCFVDNSDLKRLLGWDRMPVRAEDGMRKTLLGFMK
jgi:nucleoside-diphosphate-sugar epimerase